MFRVKLHRRVIKFLRKLNENDRRRIFLAIEKLGDPFSQPYEKVKGRIIYRVDKELFRYTSWTSEKEFMTTCKLNSGWRVRRVERIRLENAVWLGDVLSLDSFILWR